MYNKFDNLNFDLTKLKKKIENEKIKKKSFIPNIFKNNSASAFLRENSNVLEIKNELLNYTQENLTTEILAKYVLSKQKL